MSFLTPYKIPAATKKPKPSTGTNVSPGCGGGTWAIASLIKNGKTMKQKIAAIFILEKLI